MTHYKLKDLLPYFCYCLKRENRRTDNINYEEGHDINIMSDYMKEHLFDSNH